MASQTTEVLSQNYGPMVSHEIPPPPYDDVVGSENVPLTSYPPNPSYAPPYPPPYNLVQPGIGPGYPMPTHTMTDPGYAGTVNQVGYGIPKYPQVQHTVVQVQPCVMYRNSRFFMSSPVQVTCSHCNGNIVTELEFASGLLTWIICLVMIFFGMWYCCCLIPFCINDCKDVIHRCPNCKTIVGVHKRINSQW